MRLLRAACWQDISTEDKAVVVSELERQRVAEKQIIVLRDLLVAPSGKREPTAAVLSEESLSRLGTAKDVSLAQTPNKPIPDGVLANLKSCVEEAIPGCEFGCQQQKGGWFCNVRFTGHYAKPA